MKDLQALFPGLIAYEARDSADLEVDASLKGARFSDANLAALSPLAAHIVRADLSGTAIADASAPMLATMTSMRLLRLANTKITDKTMEALAGHKALKSLSVVDTGVSDAALEPLKARGVAVYGGSHE